MAKKFRVDQLVLSGNTVTANSNGLFVNNTQIQGGGTSITSAVTGFGTINYVPKFTTNNSGIYNSSIIDSGNTVYFQNNNISSATSNANFNLMASGITGIILSGNNIILNATNTEVGLLQFQSNPGVTTAFEMPVVTGSIASGAEQSYSFNTSGVSIVKVYSEYNGGTGGIQNPSFQVLEAFHLKPSGLDATVFTLGTRPFYIYTGASATTWTLPLINTCAGRTYHVKNRGNTITMTGQGGNLLFTTQVTGSLRILSGEGYILANDTTYWIAM